VGAALALTDAALGAGVMLNRAVPARISRLINVESGLNDGIATPFVLVALAGAGTAAHEPGIGPGAAVAELALGLAVGVAVGGAGGWLVRLARRRGWAAEGFAGAAVLGLAVCAYASAVALHGNGWFGPRGLASVVFALLALEDFGEQVARPAVTVIAVTVLSSVIAHGASTEPPARRYGPLLIRAAKHDDPAAPPELPTRRPSGGHQRRAPGLRRRTGQAD
jgi:NhaP-type Na+/H+ or K+/H+ antiporter